MVRSRHRVEHRDCELHWADKRDARHKKLGRPMRSAQNAAMRFKLLVLSAIAAIAASASAQEQEPKLIDRLLRPNMKLRSDEQNKKFSGRSLSESKQVSVRDFYFRDHALAKNFTGSRDVATHSANTSSFRPARSTAFIESGHKLADSTFQTNRSRASSLAYNTKKDSEQRGFRTAKFEARGKSQKALSAQSHPMTIDEVRDLLNKNK